MATVNEKMTAIADPIRTLMGATGALGLDAMASNLTGANTEVADQTALIAQIIEALEGKAGAGAPEINGFPFQAGTITLSAATTEDITISHDSLGSNARSTGFLYCMSSPGKQANMLVNAQGTQVDYNVQTSGRVYYDSNLDLVAKANYGLSISYSNKFTIEAAAASLMIPGVVYGWVRW